VTANGTNVGLRHLWRQPSIMTLRPLLALLLAAAGSLTAQVHVSGFHAGYYSPLFTQPGLVLGLSAEGRPLAAAQWRRPL
jgi:hypothetical protein